MSILRYVDRARYRITQTRVARAVLAPTALLRFFSYSARALAAAREPPAERNDELAELLGRSRRERPQFTESVTWKLP